MGCGYPPPLPVLALLTNRQEWALGGMPGTGIQDQEGRPPSLSSFLRPPPSPLQSGTHPSLAQPALTRSTRGLWKRHGPGEAWEVAWEYGVFSSAPRSGVAGARVGVLGRGGRDKQVPLASGCCWVPPPAQHSRPSPLTPSPGSPMGAGGPPCRPILQLGELRPSDSAFPPQARGIH